MVDLAYRTYTAVCILLTQFWLNSNLRKVVVSIKCSMYLELQRVIQTMNRALVIDIASRF